MGSPTTKLKCALGFLTIVEHSQQGLFGGYLVLNTAGRPIEFHCTAPIKPNRAQEILYGATLEPYLYGEQIGQTLLAKSRAEPLIVCTDREPVLAVRPYADAPLALVLPEACPPDTGGPCETAAPAGTFQPGKTWRVDASHYLDSQLCPMQFGLNHLAVRTGDRQLIADRLAVLDESFDFSEPFERIREAIEEARRGG